MKRILIPTAVAALVLGACASDGGASNDETSASLPMIGADSSSAGETLIPVEPNEGIGDGTVQRDLQVVSPDLAEEVEAALLDLTGRIGDDTVVEVIAAHGLTWPDGSLGCPQPDMSYTQALVDGYRIEFAEGANRFIYHGALGSMPFLCAEGEEGSPDLVSKSVTPSSSATSPLTEILPTSPVKEDEPTEQFGGPSGPPDE
ncbi:MAG: hypothetical protein ACR2NL_04560 [Acidimicrobiia bacterium]